MNYRKKPVVVEASQFFAAQKPWPRGVRGMRFHQIEGHYRCDSAPEYFDVVTIHGQGAIVVDGDWIIVEPDGVHAYPCKPDIFAATYEPASLSGPETDSGALENADGSALPRDLIDEWIKETWPPNAFQHGGSYSGDEVRTYVVGNLRGFYGWMQRLGKTRVVPTKFGSLTVLPPNESLSGQWEVRNDGLFLAVCGIGPHGEANASALIAALSSHRSSTPASEQKDHE